MRTWMGRQPLNSCDPGQCVILTEANLFLIMLKTPINLSARSLQNPREEPNGETEMSELNGDCLKMLNKALLTCMATHPAARSAGCMPKNREQMRYLLTSVCCERWWGKGDRSPVQSHVKDGNFSKSFPGTDEGTEEPTYSPRQPALPPAGAEHQL